MNTANTRWLKKPPSRYHTYVWLSRCVQRVTYAHSNNFIHPRAQNVHFTLTSSTFLSACQQNVTSGTDTKNSTLCTKGKKWPFPALARFAVQVGGESEAITQGQKRPLLLMMLSVFFCVTCSDDFACFALRWAINVTPAAVGNSIIRT